MANSQNHHEDEEFAPDRTLPQGTQALGVDQGHESRDIDIRALVNWLVGLAVVTGIIQVVLWVSLVALLKPAAPVGPAASEFVSAPQVPPLPRLLPNPVDNPTIPGQSLPGPVEFREENERREERELIRLKLLDGETKLPVVPGEALEALAPSAGPEPEKAEPIPSDASGGTVTEDRLR